MLYNTPAMLYNCNCLLLTGEQSQQSSLTPSREGGAAIEETVLEMSAGSREQGSNDSDTMARWLEVAKANLASDATSRGENSSVTEANSTVRPTSVAIMYVIQYNFRYSTYTEHSNIHNFYFNKDYPILYHTNASTSI